MDNHTLIAVDVAKSVFEFVVSRTPGKIHDHRGRDLLVPEEILDRADVVPAPVRPRDAATGQISAAEARRYWAGGACGGVLRVTDM